jgi:Rps23 Pro-64 3,4-dihydroxylase Tpa1-like proline 4-hydroxylase
MDHTEAIVKLDNIINPQFIERMIPFIKHRATKYLGINKGANQDSIVRDYRNVKGYHINMRGSPTDIYYWNYVKKEIQRLFFYYHTKFPLMTSSLVHQIDLLKYGPGGKYDVHTDNSTYTSRTLSVIMNMNDTYEGGDLIFTDQKENEITRYKLGKGSIIFFPSNFIYPHSIQPITKGKRYSIVAWLQ